MAKSKTLLLVPLVVKARISSSEDMEQLFQALIPEVKLETVESALETTFNTAIVDSVEQLTGGLSTSAVYKIVVHGKPYTTTWMELMDLFSTLK